MATKLTMPQAWDKDVKMLRMNGKPTEYGVRRHEHKHSPGVYSYSVLVPDAKVFSDPRNDIADYENFMVSGSDWYRHARLAAINACRRDNDDAAK